MNSVDPQMNQQKYIYLTTKGRRTGNPHTVELWFAALDQKIYLSHEGKYTDWMKNILQDSQVQFRIGRGGYNGKARIIRDAELFEKGKRALYRKYYGQASQETIDDWFSESTVVEISEIQED